MKKLKNFLLFTISSIFILSCTNEDQLQSNSNSLVGETQTLQKITGRKTTPVYSQNKLIIQYYPGTPEATKIFLRTFYGAIDFKSCQQCNDDSIELWTFGPGINIEPKKTAIEQGSGGGVESIMDVDYEFSFAMDATYSALGSYTDSNYISYIKPANDGVTIAVFDTGISPTINNNNLSAFTTPFLYNASNDGNSLTQSGWDFVNSDANCNDDDLGQHGTVVSGIIHRILNNSQPAVPHQILPIKVCDANGKASYFNLLCGTNFALSRASIIQMSLGWYNDGFGDFGQTILSNLITAHPEAIFITSAGNLGNNNDVLQHYPSGYPQSNVIAVAACNTNSQNIASFSNYGLTSVDFFARGQNLPFLGYPMDGTSFAAPIVAAVVARKKYNTPESTPIDLLNHLILTGTPCPSSFDQTKKVQYDKVIQP
ncbi:MAG: S8 family serine peptidase [Flavobacterium sp.]|nr:S8 family serine peptidase [Flavobacterium sp.]